MVFSIKDLGGLHYFLGIEVSKHGNGMVLSQEKFTKELLQESGVDVSRPVATPLPLQLKLSALDEDLLEDATLYRNLVGKLNFLTHKRPYLSYTVMILSMQAPITSHWQALTHTLRYVNHTCGQGILLQASPHITLQAFSDSNWSSCSDTRRSITGYVMMFGRPLSAGNQRNK